MINTRNIYYLLVWSPQHSIKRARSNGRAMPTGAGKEISQRAKGMQMPNMTLFSSNWVHPSSMLTTKHSSHGCPRKSSHCSQRPCKRSFQ
jgi:O-glycosyl hydrolase